MSEAEGLGPGPVLTALCSHIHLFPHPYSLSSSPLLSHFDVSVVPSAERTPHNSRELGAKYVFEKYVLDLMKGQAVQQPQGSIRKACYSSKQGSPHISQACELELTNAASETWKHVSRGADSP